MFLVDSIWKNRSTEPIWFRFFRGFVAIILTILIIYYSIYQVNRIDKETSVIVGSEELQSKNKADYTDYILFKIFELTLNFLKKAFGLIYLFVPEFLMQ